MAGTLSLKLAPGGATRMYALVATAYVAAFGLLSLSLAAGLPLGVAYGIWSAAGVVLTATASKLLLDEPLTRVMAVGSVLILGGVVMIELGASA